MTGQPEAVAGLSEEIRAELNAAVDRVVERGWTGLAADELEPVIERLIAAARADAWPCVNYVAPLTCLSAPSSETGRCDWCRATDAAAHAESAREAGEREREACAQAVEHRRACWAIGFTDVRRGLAEAALSIRARSTSSEGQAPGVEVGDE